MFSKIWTILTLVFATQFPLATQAKEALEIIFDADFSHHLESSESIKKGFELALSEYKFSRELKFVVADHRGNTKRSKKNIKNFLVNRNALFMVSGIHSPPMLSNKDFINSNKVLFFVPWAAAGPITRSNGKENWVYRLSIDDSKAGAYLANYAAMQGYQAPCLLLEDTGWGKSNLKGMTKGFSANKLKVVKTLWFKWGIKSEEAKKLFGEINKASCDVTLLVANSQEGALFVNTSAGLEKPVQIISHWGITGGNFHNVVDHSLREKVNLRFIQTKFNFVSSESNEKSNKVLKMAIAKFKDINKAEDIKASTGFVHGYDLGLLIGSVLSKTELNKSAKEVRSALKSGLENLSAPVQGLLKLYRKPFSKYTGKNKNAHEALNANDFAIGKYQKNGVIVNIN